MPAFLKSRKIISSISSNLRFFSKKAFPGGKTISIPSIPCLSWVRFFLTTSLVRLFMLLRTLALGEKFLPTTKQKRLKPNSFWAYLKTKKLSLKLCPFLKTLSMSFSFLNLFFEGSIFAPFKRITFFFPSAFFGLLLFFLLSWTVSLRNRVFFFFFFFLVDR